MSFCVRGLSVDVQIMLRKRDFGVHYLMTGQWDIYINKCCVVRPYFLLTQSGSDNIIPPAVRKPILPYGNMLEGRFGTCQHLNPL